MRKYVLERAEIFHLVRDVKWLLIVSIGLALIVAVPAQVRELYRVFIDDITFAYSYGDVQTIVVDLIRLALPLIALALIAWFGAYQVTTESLLRAKRLSSTVRDVAWGLPPFCGSLQLFAAALGQYLAQPNLANV